MPIYVYRCTVCEKEFEIHQSITESSLTHCSDCDRESLKRIPQRIGIAFVGNDFYVNQHPPKH